MNANELRLGNYVDCSKKRYNERVIKVQSICLDCINYDFRGYDVCDLIPIPITAEWLLKAGYKKQNGYGYLNYNIYGTILKNDNGFEFRYYGIIIRLNFVHQLQNLFFSFYGVELVFSTEP